MYIGFNLEVRDKTPYEKFIENEKKHFFKNQKITRAKLAELTGKNGIISAETLSSEWFPQTIDRVFISHSHKDEELAIGLSGWMRSQLNLNSFVDSSIWGYAGELLKEIDDEYNKEGSSYNYNKRNISTSHVHMILSTALIKMIDSCECIFFLNTPNSVAPNTSIQSQLTHSPWIYAEIAITNIIRKKTREQHRKLLSPTLESASQKELHITYKLELDHLNKIDQHTLQKWKNLHSLEKLKLSNLDPLDLLYQYVLK